MTWRLALEFLIRSTFITAAGLALVRLMKRKSPAFRHRLLVWTFISLAALPMLSIVLPQIPLPHWPATNLQEKITIEQTSFAIASPGGTHPPNWPLLVWAAGFLLAITHLAAGALSASWLVRRAHPLHDPDWSALLSELRLKQKLAKTPEMRVCCGLPVPLACGCLRRRILLPATAMTWDEPRRRAVLLHELAHIKRGDVAVQYFARAVAALWWFQPLVWILGRNLRIQSELACDAEVLARGFLPSAYGAELLAIAKGLGTRHQLLSPGIGIARPSDLETRLRSLIHPSSRLSPNAKLGASVLLITAVIGSASITAQPKSNLDEGGPTMRRSLFSALLTSASLSAATITGAIFDPKGSAIPDAKVVLSNPDTGAEQQATSGPDGKFAIDEAAAGQYILRVEKPGFSPLLREFNLKADSKIDRGLTLATGDPKELDQIAMSDAGSKRIRIGGEVAESNLIRKVQPVYPAAAKAAAIQGIVDLETDISKEGVPLEIRVVSSPSEDLSESALDAVRQWHYRPTLLNGNPVEIVTDVVVNYTLSK